MKKVFALCLAALMVLALAACGGSKPAETQAPAAATAAAAPAASPMPTQIGIARKSE